MAGKSKGRQRIEMVKMTNQSSLQVTYSKRRAGLFKKASELCTLCDAEVAIIVFSPGNKVFSFGHPDVEYLFTRYLMGNYAESSGARNANANDSHLSSQLTHVLEELEMENKRAEELKGELQESRSQRWWEKPIDELTLSQLMELKLNLEQLKEVSAKRIESVHISQQNPTFQYFGDAGNTSNIIPALDNMFLPPPPLPPAELAPAFDGFNNMNLTMMQTAPPFPEYNVPNFNYSGQGQDILHTLVPLTLSLPPPPPPPAVAENEVQQQHLQEDAQDFPSGFNDVLY